MPINRNSRLMKLPNVDTKVWRYMKYNRFKDFIESGKLFFPSYKSLNDAFEMTIEDKRYENMIEKDREYFIISCWSFHKYEQYSLWSTYLKGNKEGIAIVITYNDLCDSFDKYPHEITPGIVKYQNTLNGDILYRHHPNGRQINFHKYVFYKKRYYQTDKELRLIRYHIIPNGSIMDLTPVGKGISIPCDVNTLIKKIILSPFANEYFKKKVKRLLKENGLDNVVIKSSKILLK